MFLNIFIQSFLFCATVLGQINDRIEQALRFQFKGETAVNLGDCGPTGCIRVEADKLLIRGNQSGNRYIEISIDHPKGPGEYIISSANRIELGRGRRFENKTYRSSFFSCEGCNASYPVGKIVITKLEGPGGYIEGNFKTSLYEIGVWKDQEPLEGTFKVYRER